MTVEDLIAAYNDCEFTDGAVDEMATVFEDNEQLLTAAQDAPEAQASQASLELAGQWAGVWERHDITDETRRNALLLQGMDRCLEELYQNARNETIVRMAVGLAGSEG